jgi:hypothetical protein
MEQAAHIEQPSMLARTFFRIGERMFGKVPTPERLMARRMPLMLGLGALYGAIEGVSPDLSRGAAQVSTRR